MGHRALPRMIGMLAVVVTVSLPLTAAHAVATDFLFSFGSFGSGDGQFSSPSSISIGPTGDVYVLDGGNQRIEKFDAGGHFVTKWNNARSMTEIGDLTVAADGSVFVQAAHTIQKYDGNGTYQYYWNAATTSSYGQEVTMDPAGNVCFKYEFNAGCIRKFTSGGAFVSPERCDGNPFFGAVYDAAGNLFHVQYYPPGATQPQIVKRDANFAVIMRWPAASGRLAVDLAGNVYGADQLGNVVRVYDNNGVFLGQFGSAGSGPGQFNRVEDLAVGPDGRIYVVDKGNNRVQVFGAAPVPARVATWGRIKSAYR